jgi:hypothetical protein
MKRLARKLDKALKSVGALEALSTTLDGIKDEDLRGLLEATENPIIQKRAKAVNSPAFGGVEFLGALLKAATLEMKRLGELCDVEADFPEVVDPLPPSPDQTEPVTTSVDETVVNIQVEGPDGVEIVHENDDIYVILPDDGVLKMSEASSTERVAILAKRSTSNN